MRSLQTRQSVRKRPKRPNLSPQEMRQRDERLVELYQSGLTSIEAAREVGLGRSRARVILKWYGVSRPTGRHRGTS